MTLSYDLKCLHVIYLPLVAMETQHCDIILTLLQCIGQWLQDHNMLSQHCISTQLNIKICRIFLKISNAFTDT